MSENMFSPQRERSPVTRINEKSIDEVRFTLLDLRTQLGNSDTDSAQLAGWRLTTWPDCSEASLVWVKSRTSSFAAGPTKLDDDWQRAEDLAIFEAEERYRHDYADFFADADEYYLRLQKQNWLISNGRAAAKSRRYFVRNRLRYMWVLTFAGEHWERRQVMADVAEFARRVRAAHGSKPFPYWYSPELHPGGHGWHVNFFVSDRLDHKRMAELWDLGFVWVVDYGSVSSGAKGEPLRRCRTPRDAWRRAAQYGCKYSQKDWSPEHVGRSNHRYEVAQGFAPEKLTQWVHDPRHAEQIVAGAISPEDWSHLKMWDSNDENEWLRPPVRTWRW